MSLLLLSILIFLALALLFYVLFAGADFGAGILEAFLGTTRRQDQRRLIAHAMAPVWEANHVWLVLAIVILFMGFPPIYTTLSIYLHLPIIALLIGIVGRGCAFTFRNYDPPSRGLHVIYSRIFAFSSLWTSFFIGVVAAAAMLGRIDPAGESFYDLYLAPWLNPFCFVLGLFTISLFAFLAAVYLVGETRDEELRDLFRQKARVANITVVVLGALVFASAELDGFHLARDFFSEPVSVICFVTATLLLFPFWKGLRTHGGSLMVRGLAVAIVTLVLLGWYAVQYPIALRLHQTGGSGLTFGEAAAPDATLRVLLGALLVGSVLIFPALGYLLRIFKWETLERTREP